MNEKGAILPLTLIISLIIALLLLNFANRIESQVISYEFRQTHLTMSILEKECIFYIVEQLNDSDFLTQAPPPSHQLLLNNETTATISYKNSSALLDVEYKFNYNGYLGLGTVSYDKTKQTYTLK